MFQATVDSESRRFCYIFYPAHFTVELETPSQLYLNFLPFQREPLVSREASWLSGLAMGPKNLKGILKLILGSALEGKACSGLQNQLTAFSFFTCRKPPLAMCHLIAFTCSESRPCVGMTCAVTSARRCSFKVRLVPFFLAPSAPVPLLLYAALSFFLLRDLDQKKKKKAGLRIRVWF